MQGKIDVDKTKEKKSLGNLIPDGAPVPAPPKKKGGCVIS